MKAALSLFVLAVGFRADAWTIAGQGLGGWTGARITVQYSFADCPVAESDLLMALDQAVQVWNASQNSGVSLSRASVGVRAKVPELMAGKAPTTPIVLCDPRFSASQGADGNSIPAVTRIASVGGRIGYAGVILNGDKGKAASVDRLSPSQLAVVITHELGHALGLGHSSVAAAVMYYDITGKSKPALTQDDMDGLAFLYPRNEFSLGPFGCARVDRSPERAGGGAAWVVLLLLFSLCLGRYFRFRRGFPLPQT